MIATFSNTLTWERKACQGYHLLPNPWLHGETVDIEVRSMCCDLSGNTGVTVSPVYPCAFWSWGWAVFIIYTTGPKAIVSTTHECIPLPFNFLSALNFASIMTRVLCSHTNHPVSGQFYLLKSRNKSKRRSVRGRYQQGQTLLLKKCPVFIWFGVSHYFNCIAVFPMEICYKLLTNWKSTVNIKGNFTSLSVINSY